MIPQHRTEDDPHVTSASVVVIGSSTEQVVSFASCSPATVMHLWLFITAGHAFSQSEHIAVLSFTSSVSF